MGVSMAVMEHDTEASLCYEAKGAVLKVLMKSIDGLRDHADYDMVVDPQILEEVFDDVAAFMKRNRIDPESDPIYMEKVKKDSDVKALEPHQRREFTGWVTMDGMPTDLAARVLKEANGDDVVTGWDMYSFDEMNDTCAKCPLSWDKGRGCIGTFGPENSKLPEIAAKAGCPIVTSAVEASLDQRRFSAADATALIEEVAILKEKLPEEGKMMVRRYSGVLDRLEAMASVCVEHGIGFYFL